MNDKQTFKTYHTISSSYMNWKAKETKDGGHYLFQKSTHRPLNTRSSPTLPCYFYTKLGSSLHLWVSQLQVTFPWMKPLPADATMC